MQAELADSINKLIFFQTMKKHFSFFAVAMLVVFATSFVACNNEASKDKAYTLQIAADEFKYDDNGIWAQTFDSTTMGFTSSVFSFLHVGMSSPYTYWEGFIPSVAQKDGDAYGYYSCMAKGGLKGVGSPYVLGYWSEYSGGITYVIFSENDSTPLVAVPQEIYFCNATQSYKDVTEGDYAGYKFSKENNDYFVVKVFGLTGDPKAEKTTLTANSVDYYLADFRDGKEFVNDAWAKVDLTALGEVYGLKFVMESTGKGDYGINTSTYFAIDGLRVKKAK